MSTAVSAHTGAGPLSLMSCVRESSPPQDMDVEYENEKNVGGGQKKKRFWNRWFSKRKNKVVVEEATSSPPTSPDEIGDFPRESQRSRSTSELSDAEEAVARRRSGTAPMHPGLSVSHDSVFHSPHSGSEIELQGAQSSSSLSIHHQHQADRLLQTELTERLRLRRGRGDVSEDDEGLPRSPCNSPTATDKTAIKDNPKSHSTCSEGSLLSVGSSEMDEDSFGQHSIHSSKLSLDEKNTGTDGDFDLDLGFKNTSAPLNHSGARHKASVKPQRRHGAPRKKRLSGSVLPTTPEVNEENAVRSISPEGISTTKETVLELYQSASTTTSTTTVTSIAVDKQLKCSSLPPGLAPPGRNSDTASSKLNRSRSNAGAKYNEGFSELGEDEVQQEKEAKKDSFLGRIFPRRSLKKKKISTKEEKISVSSTTLSTETRERIEVKPIPIPRTGAAARQRVAPGEIPASPELPPKSPASPLQIELESHFQQRLASLSNPKAPKTPPVSPRANRTHHPPLSPPRSPISQKVPPKIIEKKRISDNKMIITGLSPFQLKAMNNNNNNENEDDNDGFKSLEIPAEDIRPRLVVKSHSFKINNCDNCDDALTNKARYVTTFAELANSKSGENRKEDIQTKPKEGVKIVKEEVKMKKEEEIISKESSVQNQTEIFISGPLHKAVVSVTNSESTETKIETSVTKIQVKTESTVIPEFMNIQLNRVEKAANNVVLTAGFEGSKTEEEIEADGEEEIKNCDSTENLRKFSKDDIEIIDKVAASQEDEDMKHVTTALVTITTMTPPLPNRIFKKSESNQYQLRKSMISVGTGEKPILKAKSSSLDLVESMRSSEDLLKIEEKIELKAKTQSANDLNEMVNAESTVALRRKSLAKQKQEDEPELLKVFARRSLKLKDGEGENIGQQVVKMLEEETQKSRDSDKENRDSPPKDRKKMASKPKENRTTESMADVALRKSNNKLLYTSYQRTVSLNNAKTNELNSNYDRLQKQNALCDRPKTMDQWITYRTVEDESCPKICQEEIIEKEELCTKPKNFNQRKAEWEKRAQEASRKTTP